MNENNKEENDIDSISKFNNEAITNKMKTSFTSFHNRVSSKRKFSIVKNKTNNLAISNQDFKNLNTNFLKEKLILDFKDKEKEKDNKEKNINNIQIPLLKKTLNNFEVNIQQEKNENMNNIISLNKNGYTLSHSSGQGDNISNLGNNIQQNIKMSNKKGVDPTLIYMTPTQKIYKTLNDNILFYNKYNTKKK